MKKCALILLIAGGFLSLSSCDGANAECFDPKLCPEKMQQEHQDKVEKPDRRW
ncbi:MAG: hypothetical protein AAGI90_00720 [Chlamydiota bacterium]